MSTTMRSVSPMIDPSMILLSKCPVSVFIPKKLVTSVRGSINAENTVRYLMVEFVLSSKILLRVSSIESIFSCMISVSE